MEINNWQNSRVQQVLPDCCGIKVCSFTCSHFIQLHVFSGNTAQIPPSSVSPCSVFVVHYILWKQHLLSAYIFPHSLQVASLALIKIFMAPLRVFSHWCSCAGATQQTNSTMSSSVLCWNLTLDHNTHTEQWYWGINRVVVQWSDHEAGQKDDLISEIYWCSLIKTLSRRGEAELMQWVSLLVHFAVCLSNS